MYSRAKVVAADGPPGVPIQTFTPVKLTVKIDKDALLQDYGFHISESLPLTVVAVTAGRGPWWPSQQVGAEWEMRKEFGLLRGNSPSLFPSLSYNVIFQVLPQEVKNGMPNSVLGFVPSFGAGREGAPRAFEPRLPLTSASAFPSVAPWPSQGQ